MINQDLLCILQESLDYLCDYQAIMKVECESNHRFDAFIAELDKHIVDLEDIIVEQHIMLRMDNENEGIVFVGECNEGVENDSRI